MENMANSPMFLTLFNKSPLVPVHAHLQKCADCTSELVEYFEAVFQERWDEAGKLYHSIGDCEHDADELKKEVRLNVPRSLLSSVSREDLLELVHIQDKIANATQDIAGLILGRQMTFPEAVQPGLREFLRESLRSVQLAVDTGNRLIELTKTGFSNRGVEEISTQLEELHTAETASDGLQRELRSTLYQIESTLKPVDVMFIYKILDLIGEISDSAQSAGNRMLYIAYS